MKRRIRLSERDLHRVIKESVKRVLREEASYYRDDYDSTGTQIGQTQVDLSELSDDELYRQFGLIMARTNPEAQYGEDVVQAFRDEFRERGL